ncbi:MAG: hypothetical protein R3190_10935, partial [Thermoanaerobaculia bacterium]|nr:hypothetical protein [Thermoanaerobaculia bacterium]
MSRRPQLPAPLRWASLGAMALVIAAGGACTGPGPEGAGGADAAPLPAIDLVERGSFPLPAHLESEDLAAGTLANVEIFEAGEALFHTAFNGLDGVGIARDDDGNP